MTNVGAGIFKPVGRVLAAAMWLTVALVLGACVTPQGIATDVVYCCSPRAAAIETFRVEFEDMPEFLKPMLRDEASIVLGAKGYEYTEDESDIVLRMKYVNRTFDTGDAAHDEAWETIAPGGGVRFIAEVAMELTDTVREERIWSATMGRVHNVYEGSYMHDAPARSAMREAFLRIFTDFPAARGESPAM